MKNTEGVLILKKSKSISQKVYLFSSKVIYFILSFLFLKNMYYIYVHS